MTGPAELRVYVNERGVNVAPGATALDAVRVHDAEEAARVEAGARTIVDSRGLPITSETAAHGGAIYRTISRRVAGDDA